MSRRIELSVETLQTKIHLDQAVVVSQVGHVPAVFIVFSKDGKPGAHDVQPDALTAMTAERSREMALALWSAADKVDQLNAEPGEDR